MHLLSPPEVAELLGITEHTLAQWRYRGSGPTYVKISHKAVRYPRADLEAWVDARTILTQPNARSSDG